MNKLAKKIGEQVLFASESLEDMPQLDQIDPSHNNFFIWDDMLLEKSQKTIEELYIRGRQLNCSLCYISQSYFSCSKLIRKQCDYIFIKKINTQNDLKRIISEYNLNDVTPQQLVEFYKQIVAKGMENFLLIDLKTDDPKLKFRMNFG